MKEMDHSPEREREREGRSERMIRRDRVCVRERRSVKERDRESMKYYYSEGREGQRYRIKKSTHQISEV